MVPLSSGSVWYMMTSFSLLRKSSIPHSSHNGISSIKSTQPAFFYWHLCSCGLIPCIHASLAPQNTLTASCKNFRWDYIMLWHTWQNDSIASLYSAIGTFALAETCSNRKLRSLRMDLMSFSWVMPFFFTKRFQVLITVWNWMIFCSLTAYTFMLPVDHNLKP